MPDIRVCFQKYVKQCCDVTDSIVYLRVILVQLDDKNDECKINFSTTRHRLATFRFRGQTNTKFLRNLGSLCSVTASRLATNSTAYLLLLYL